MNKCTLQWEVRQLISRILGDQDLRCESTKLLNVIKLQLHWVWYMQLGKCEIHAQIFVLPLKCYSDFVCRLGDEIESPERAIPCLERFRHYRNLWRNRSAGNDFPVFERGLSRKGLTMTVAGGSALACVFDLASKKQRSAVIRLPNYIWEGGNGGMCVLNNLLSDGSQRS